MRLHFARQFLHTVGLRQKPMNYAWECANKFGAAQLGDKGRAKRIVHGARQIVEAAAIICRKVAAQTREVQRIIARGADPIFRMPIAAALNAKSRAQKKM